MAINTEANTVLAGLLSTPPVLPGGPAKLSGASTAAKTRAEGPAIPAGLGTLVPLASIQGGVVEGLQNSVRDATGKLNSLVAEDQYTSRLKDLLGTTGDPASLGRSLQQINGAVAALATDPTQPAAGVVQALGAFTGKLRSTSSQVQALRGQADQALGSAVAQTNSVLQQIATLNDSVAVSTANGGSTTDAAARRGSALDALAGSLDFTSFSRADGSLALLTKGGAPLVSGAAATLSFTPAATVDATSSVANGSLSGVTANGTDITGQLSGGTISALLQTRDVTLPNVQNQLDTLAQTLQSRVNQVTNRAVGQGGARASYTGTRAFDGSADQRISLAGGDTIVSLVNADGSAQATTSMTMLMKSYQQASGIPTGNAWSAGQMASALNVWLGRQLSDSSATYASLDGDGHLSIQLPAGTSDRLAFRDQRSITYQSSAIADASKPLGLSGALTFTDNAGNRMSTALAVPPLTIGPGDSLTGIAKKLNAVAGVTATLAPADGGTRLVVTSATASDLALEPDSGGSTVVAGLGLAPAPAPDQPAEDVAVQFRSGQAAGNLTSTPVPSASAPLGLRGSLSFAGTDGAALGALGVSPAWSLNTLAAQINAATGSQGLNASVVPTGNQFTLKLSAQNGQQVSLDGTSNGLQSSPVAKFWAAGGNLTIASDGTTVGRLTVKPGDGLQTIADAVNAPDGAFATAGIQATVHQLGNGESLEIGTADGRPLVVGGSAAGSGPGQLDLQLNPGDALGLQPAADQVVSGFANFLGLNDLFVADPSEAFDGKAPTGIFASTATAGTAQALAVNPAFVDDPSALAAQGTIQPLSDLLNGQTNVASAGGLPRGSYNLAQYADGIVAAAAANASTTKSQIAYQRVLADSLGNQQATVTGMDMNDRLTNLADYQQAYQDSARIISTMPQLLQRLGAAAN